MFVTVSLLLENSIPLGGGKLNPPENPIAATNSASLKMDIKAKFTNQNKRATTNVFGKTFKASPEHHQHSNAATSMTLTTSKVDLHGLADNKKMCGERHEFMLK